MLEKLDQIVSRYEELTQELSSPELTSNPSAYAKAAKQHRALEEVVRKYQAWKGLKAEFAGARELYDTSDDEEMREMARLELETLQARLEETDQQLKQQLELLVRLCESSLQRVKFEPRHLAHLVVVGRVV